MDDLAKQKNALKRSASFPVMNQRVDFTSQEKYREEQKAKKKLVKETMGDENPEEEEDVVDEQAEEQMSMPHMLIGGKTELPISKGCSGEKAG